jgi:hypothetical protein
MKIKVGTTHYKNFPERFEQNHITPIPIIELWFDDKEKMRIQRDGFIMPTAEEIRKVLKELNEAIEMLDDVNELKRENGNG